MIVKLPITDSHIERSGAHFATQAHNAFREDIRAILQETLLKHAYPEVYDWIMEHSGDCTVEFIDQHFVVNVMRGVETFPVQP